LACYGNLTATINVKKGKLTELLLSPGKPNIPAYRTIIIPERLVEPRKVNKKAVSSMEIKDGYYFIDVQITNQTNLFL
jgi:hypothetical protein